MRNDRIDGDLIEAQMGAYLEHLLDSAPFQEASESTRWPTPPLSIEGFFRIFGQLVDKQLELEGGGAKLEYTEEFPDDVEPFHGEAIVTSLVNREPEVFQQTGIDRAMGGRAMVRNRRPRFREAYPDPNNPGLVIVNKSRYYDNKVLFTVVAKSNKTANRRALWLEDLIETYRWYLLANGIGRIEFLKREEDYVLSPGKTKLAARPLYYLVRTQRVTVIKEFELRSILLKSSLQQDEM